METLNLNPGQTILIDAKAVKGGKVTFHFAQLMPNPFTATDLTSLANKSDDRFNKQKPRHCWTTGMPEDFKTLFGIDTSSLEEGQTLEIGQLDPKVDGQLLNIELVERTVKTGKVSDYELANVEKEAKRVEKDGEFILYDGEYVFVDAKMVARQPNHKIFTGEKLSRQAPITTMDKEAIAAALLGD